MRHHKIRITVVGVPLLAGLLAACGGEKSSPGVAALASGAPAATATGAATPMSEADRRAALVKYAQCMRGHGIPDFPDPVGNGFKIKAEQGSDLSQQSPRFQAAESACKNLMPPPRGTVAERRAGMLKVSACMRAHGFPKFPDPDSNGGIHIESKGDDGGMNPDSPQFQAAQRTCEALLSSPAAKP
jgi:hypothetical protein